MTHSELLEIIMPKLAEAKKKLEFSVHAPYIFVENEISYMDDNGEETKEFKGQGETILFASLIVYIRDRYEENDPSFAVCMDFDLKNTTVMDPGTVDNKISELMETVLDFADRLEAAPDAAEFITKEHIKLEEEAKEALKNFEESTKKMEKTAIAISIGVVAIAIIIIILSNLFK